MYIVSEVKKKTRTWGKGICQVFYISNLRSKPSNVTSQLADKFWYEYKKWNIEIPYWSGTWFMKIKQDLLSKDESIHVYDVSIF